MKVISTRNLFLAALVCYLARAQLEDDEHPKISATTKKTGAIIFIRFPANRFPEMEQLFQQHYVPNDETGRIVVFTNQVRPVGMLEGEDWDHTKGLAVVYFQKRNLLKNWWGVVTKSYEDTDLMKDMDGCLFALEGTIEDDHFSSGALLFTLMRPKPRLAVDLQSDIEDLQDLLADSGAQPIKINQAIMTPDMSGNEAKIFMQNWLPVKGKWPAQYTRCTITLIGQISQMYPIFRSTRFKELQPRFSEHAETWDTFVMETYIPPESAPRGIRWYHVAMVTIVFVGGFFAFKMSTQQKESKAWRD